MRNWGFRGGCNFEGDLTRCGLERRVLEGAYFRCGMRFVLRSYVFWSSLMTR